MSPSQAATFPPTQVNPVVTSIIGCSEYILGFFKTEAYFATNLLRDQIQDHFIKLQKRVSSVLSEARFWQFFRFLLQKKVASNNTFLDALASLRPVLEIH